MTTNGVIMTKSVTRGGVIDTTLVVDFRLELDERGDAFVVMYDQFRDHRNRAVIRLSFALFQFRHYNLQQSGRPTLVEDAILDAIKVSTDVVVAYRKVWEPWEL